MKNVILKSVLPAAVALLFILPQACNQSGKDQGQNETHEHDSLVSYKLTLNNGVKWKADGPTKKNAAILISIGEQFSKKSNRTLEDYHAFGQDINSGINTMIKECTMEGEEDKALHLWFLPLLNQVSSLKNATDTAGLSNITSEMIHRLGIYKDYFE